MKLTATKTMILAAMAFSSAAFAQTKAPEPDYTFAYNVGLVTDYRFRGISQSRLKPALQGGIDFTHKSGFYLGAWGSTIKILKDFPGQDGPIELDFYGGYRSAFGESGVSYDIGLLRYQYPKENFTPTVNTTELYGALTYGPATVKYSHSLGDETFGWGASKNSYYLEAAATFDLGSGFSLTPHIGHQEIKGINNVASYTDYSLSLGKDFGVASLAVAYIKTTSDAYIAPTNGKNLGKGGLVLTVSKTF